mmetsp:Transcript_57575/g.168634  ORF Transcript_57575/g.168634 Transcript_57575/m.168634 type:complete len:403 (-) Transcript_57575:433-1641(-)
MRATALVCVGLCSVLQGPGRVCEAALTQEQRDAVLAEHNKLRGQEGASDMPALVYDLDIEATAQRFVDLCTFQHSADAYEYYPRTCGTLEENRCGQAYGENFGMSTTSHYTLTFATNDWYSEKPDWTYTDGVYDDSYCDTTGGKMCGHYTQVVSKQSRRIGCALKTDCTGSSAGWTSLGLCQYDPPGNVNTYMLFTTGTACSACMIGYDCCESNVCFGSKPTVPTTGQIEWQFLCNNGPMDTLTWDVGTCNTFDLAMGKYYKLELDVVYDGTAPNTGRAWGVKRTKCDDAACSTNCQSFSTVELDVCASGMSHRYTWQGAALPSAPATLTSGAVGSCAGGNGDGDGNGNMNGNGNSSTTVHGGSGATTTSEPAAAIVNNAASPSMVALVSAGSALISVAGAV